MVPARTTWRRALMPRQPYSEAVPSTGGRLHPLVPEGKRGLERKVEPSLRVRKDGLVFENIFNGKEGRDDFRTPFLQKK